jgi:hypothetical protein
MAGRSASSLLGVQADDSSLEGADRAVKLVDDSRGDAADGRGRDQPGEGGDK